MVPRDPASPPKLNQNNTKHKIPMKHIPPHLRPAILLGSALALANVHGQSSEWNLNNAGNWNLDSNWTPNTVPNATAYEAVFGNIITAGRVITINDAFTVGKLRFNHSLGQTYTISSNGTLPHYLIMDDDDGTANISITHGNQSLTLTTPMVLEDNLEIHLNFSPSEPTNAGRGMSFRNALLSTANRTVTLRNDSTFLSSSNRNTLTSANCFDNFKGNLLIRGNATLNTGHSIDLNTSIGAHVPIDIDTTSFIRAGSTTIRGPVSFGGNYSRISHNQGNGGVTNLRLAGPLTGGGPDHKLIFDMQQGQAYLDNPQATNTYQGTIALLSTANISSVLWVSRDDQLGHPNNKLQFFGTGAGGPTNDFASGGGFAIPNDLSLSRSLLIGMDTGANSYSMSFLTPKGLTLTLNGGNSQISRPLDNTANAHSFVKHGAGTLVLTGNASFDPGDYFRGPDNTISGTLRLDNTTTNVNDRLGATVAAGTFRLSNGRVEFAGGSGAPQSETILRTLQPTVGGSTILASSGSGQTSTVTFNSLARTSNQSFGHFPTLNFGTLAGSSAALGSADNRILLNTPPTLANGIIGGWARSGNDWATNGANGIEPLASYTAIATSTDTDNAVMNVDTSLAAVISANSLKIAGSGLTLDLADQSLALTTGGLINTGNNTITGTTGTITTGTGQLIIQDNGELNIGSALGSDVLVKSGTGTTTLSGTGNSQNATVINEGTLVISDDGQLGAPMIWGNTTTSTLPSGYVVLAGGTLKAADGSAPDLERAIVLGGTQSSFNNLHNSGSPFADNTIEVGADAELTLRSKISGGPGAGGVAFTKTGPGTLILANTGVSTTTAYGLSSANSGISAHDFSGNIVIEEGTIRSTSDGNLGFLFAGNPNGDTNNDIVFRGGTLEFFNYVRAIGGGGNNRSFYVEEGGGTLRVVELQTAQTLSIGCQEGIVYRGPNPGSFDITQDEGTPNLAVTYVGNNNAGGTEESVTRITGANSNYRGGTQINAGTVLVAVDAPSDAPGAFGSSTANVILGNTSLATPGQNINLYIDTPDVTIDRNLLVINTNSESLGSKVRIGGIHSTGSSTYTGALNLPRGANLHAATGGSVAFSGLIQNIGSVTKSGGGVVELTFANTYTGNTTVEAGTLLVNNTGITSGTGTGDVTVLSGGTLGGNGRFTGALSVQSGGVVAPGASIGTLTVANSAAIAGSYACQLDGASSDLLVVDGDLDLTGASLSVSTLGTPTETSYLIATYTGTLTGIFASVTPGYVANYETAGEIRLEPGETPPPANNYASWAEDNGIDRRTLRWRLRQRRHLQWHGIRPRSQPDRQQPACRQPQWQHPELHQGRGSHRERRRELDH
jgi:autotransporter-associated beta strand protein